MRRERIGPYRLLERLPHGRLGEVWRGRDERNGRDVAVRVLPALFFGTDDERREFRHAALSLLRVHHPNVADTLDFVTEDGANAVITEFVPGETLETMMKRGRMSETDAARITAQIAEGLASGHDRGVAHRVLNPRNVRITPEGDARILDFGLPRHATAPVLPSSEPPPADAAANPADRIAYAAPEQLGGRRGDGRSDLYTLGVMLYEMLTGERPHGSADPNTLAYQVAHTPAPPPGRFRRGLSPRIEEIALMCLELEPGDRYLNGHDLATDLRALDPRATTTRAPDPTLRHASRVWAVVYALMILAAVAFGLLIGDVGRLRERLLDRMLTGTSGPLPGEIRSVAVMPLRDFAREDDAGALGLGFGDALARRLGVVRALRVVGPAPGAEPYVRPDSLPALGRRLLVDVVVTGTLSRAGDQWRVHLVARRPSDGHTIWDGSAIGSPSDAENLEVRLVRDLLNAMRVTAADREVPNLMRGRTAKPEAIGSYLRARAYLLREDPASLAQAATLLHRALDLDSMDTRSWAALATIEIRARQSLARAPDVAACARIKGAALRALAIEPDEAEAHLAWGYAQWRCDHDPVGAEPNLLAALALAPSDVLARLTYAELLGVTDRFEQRVLETRRAMAEAPWAPAPHVALARCHVYLHQFDRASAQCRRALELDPRANGAWTTLARSEACAGRWGAALAAQRAADSLGGSSGTRWLRLRAAAATGDPAATKELWRPLADLMALGEAGPLDAALACAAVGDTDASVAWLARGVAGGDLATADLRMAPELDPMRADRRFQALLARLTSPPAPAR